MTATRWKDVAAATLAVLLALTVTACSPGGDAEPTAAPIVVEKDLTYPGGDGSALGVDACRPGDDAAHPAVVLVHGGAFSEGDRTTMAGVCSELAKNGYAAFAVDYRQLPATYPAQIDDVQASVLWLREPEQVERFRLSSTVSLLGSSAGAIISLSTAAALAGNDAPVASVVALSPAASLTADAAELGDPRPDLEKVVLGYLGCDVITDCPIAEQASPVASAALLPPTLIVHGTDELIPLAQAELLDDALSTDGIEHELVVVDGTRHGLQLLDSAVKADVIEFLGAHAS